MSMSATRALSAAGLRMTARARSKMNSVKTLIIKRCRDGVLKLVSIFCAGMWLRSLREGQRVNVLASDLEGEGDREDGRQAGITSAAFAGGIGVTYERERRHDGYRHVAK